MSGLPYYNTGTVSGTNSSGALTFSGADIPNNVAIGYGIILPDGPSGALQLHIITAIASDAATIAPALTADLSGVAYVIFQASGMSPKAVADLNTLLTSSNYSDIASLDPASDDFLQFLSGHWDNRSPIQVLLSLFSNQTECSIPGASTTDIGGSSVTTPKVQITGSGASITSLGTAKNCFRMGYFAGAHTLVNGSNIKVNNAGSNYTTVAGDRFIAWSDNQATPVWYITIIGTADVATRTTTQTLTNKTFIAPGLGAATAISISAGATAVQENARLYGKSAVSTQWTDAILRLDTYDADSVITIYNGASRTWNASQTVMRIAANSVTSSSIAAAGAVGASGADFAEYKWKRSDCAVIAAGRVCGLDCDGKVTDAWSLLKSPRVKSGAHGVKPAFVAGVDWNSPNVVCVLDGEPLGERPVAPSRPSDEPTDAERDAYDAAKAAYDDAASAFEPRYEGNRAMVDRIAYAGTVFLRNDERIGAAAQAGDFIVLCEGDGDAIAWQAVSAITSFDLQALCIGRVELVDDEGWPLIAVKI